MPTGLSVFPLNQSRHWHGNNTPGSPTRLSQINAAPYVAYSSALSRDHTHQYQNQRSAHTHASVYSNLSPSMSPVRGQGATNTSQYLIYNNSTSANYHSHQHPLHSYDNNGVVDDGSMDGGEGDAMSDSFVSNPSPLTASAATTPRGGTPRRGHSNRSPNRYSKRQPSPSKQRLTEDAPPSSPHRAMQRWLELQHSGADLLGVSRSPSSSSFSTGSSWSSSDSQSSSTHDGVDGSRHLVEIGNRTSRMDVLNENDSEGDMHSSDYTSDEIEDLCHDEDMLQLLATAAVALMRKNAHQQEPERSVSDSTIPAPSEISSLTSPNPRPLRVGKPASVNQSVVSTRSEASLYRTCTPNQGLHHIDPISPMSTFNIHTVGLTPQQLQDRRPNAAPSGSHTITTNSTTNTFRSVHMSSHLKQPKGPSQGTPNLNNRLASPRRKAAMSGDGMIVSGSTDVREMLGRYRKLKAQYGEEWRAEAQLQNRFTPELDKIHDIFANSASLLAKKARKEQLDKANTSGVVKSLPEEDVDSDDAVDDDDDSSSEYAETKADVARAACGRLYALHEASVERQRTRQSAEEQEFLIEQAALERRKNPSRIVPNERQLRLYNLSSARICLPSPQRDKERGRSPQIDPRSRKIAEASRRYPANRHCPPPLSSPSSAPLSPSPSRRGSIQHPLSDGVVGVLVVSSGGGGCTSPSHNSASSHPFNKSPFSRRLSSAGDPSSVSRNGSGILRRSNSNVGERLYTDALRRERSLNSMRSSKQDEESKGRRPSVSVETQLWYDTRKAEIVHRRRERHRSIVELIHNASDTSGGVCGVASPSPQHLNDDHQHNHDHAFNFEVDDVPPCRHSRSPVYHESSPDKLLSPTFEGKKVSFAAVSATTQGFQSVTEVFEAVEVNSRSGSSTDSTLAHT